MGMELNPNTFIVHCCYYKVADSLYLDTVQLQSCVALLFLFVCIIDSYEYDQSHFCHHSTILSKSILLIFQYA